jgi:SAM-dependent methyltransferase
MREWFENEAFWRGMYPFLFDERRFAVAAEEVRKIVKLTGVRQGTVLDLCCGPGRHSVVLAKRGFQVTGVDRTRFLLSKARRRARTVRVRVEFVESDVRDFVRPGAYRLALNLFTAFGYFDKKDDDRLVLRNIFESLQPRGVCVFDVCGKERLAKFFSGTDSERLADGTLLIRTYEVFDDWTRVRNEWIFLKGNRARRFQFHQTVYSGQELKDLLRQTGFTEVKLYGDLDGQPFGPDPPRLVAVARK